VWEDLLGDLAREARVLDIATGNGAIALIAAEVSGHRELALQIDACDAAAIDPGHSLKAPPSALADIRFHARAPTEHLPFGDACFDAVTGQFALEYSDAQSSLTELARVLKPGARGRFVIHHADSVIVRTAAEEVRLAKLVVDGSGVFDAARALIRYIAPAVTRDQQAALGRDPQAERRRHAFNASAARVAEAVERARHPEIGQFALGHISDAYRRRRERGLEGTLEVLDRAETEVRASLQRLRDLRGAALDEPGIERLCRMARQSGLTDAALDTVHHQGELVGWLLDLTRHPVTASRRA
jgi:SAM-dependent methyltransferase